MSIIGLSRTILATQIATAIEQDGGNLGPREGNTVGPALAKVIHDTFSLPPGPSVDPIRELMERTARELIERENEWARQTAEVLKVPIEEIPKLFRAQRIVKWQDNGSALIHTQFTRIK